MPHTLSPHAMLHASTECLSSELAGEAVILSLANGTYYGTDVVGARVWQLLQRPHTVAELRDAITAEFDVTPERCEGDLQEFLADLREHGLLEVTGDGA